MAIMEKNDTYIGRVKVTMVCGCVSVGVCARAQGGGSFGHLN